MTRDLASRVPLRDSGIPWLGEIPAHWAATRLKFVAEIQGGFTLGKNYGAAMGIMILKNCAQARGEKFGEDKPDKK